MDPLGFVSYGSSELRSVTRVDCTQVMDSAWFPGLGGNLGREKDVVRGP